MQLESSSRPTLGVDVLLTNLNKLACMSKRLRQAVLRKTAAGTLGGFLGQTKNFLKNNKTLAAAGTLGGGALTAMSAGSTASQNYQGFKPEMQAARLGRIPIPPG